MRFTARAVCAAVLLALCGAPAAGGHETAIPRGAGAEKGTEVGIAERPGQYMPLNAPFLDEEGTKIPLSSVLGRPVILSLVYFSCEHICPQLLGALADALRKTRLEAGKDYTALTISFDPDDTPAGAREAKGNYLNAMGGAFPEASWRFLTGNETSIKEVLDAVGFRIRKEELHGFAHPAALVVLSPEGKIVRYLYTTAYAYGAPGRMSFEPFDLEMALADAVRERVGKESRRTALFCFPHQPQGQERFYAVLKVLGGAMAAALVSLFLYLTMSGRRKKGAS